MAIFHFQNYSKSTEKTLGVNWKNSFLRFPWVLLRKHLMLTHPGFAEAGQSEDYYYYYSYYLHLGFKVTKWGTPTSYPVGWVLEFGIS